MRDVVIVDGVRSPIGKFGGGLSKVRPDDLLAEVFKGLMERTCVNPALLDDVYAGCGNQGGEDNRFSAGDLSGKVRCKRALVRELGLVGGDRVPLLVFVGRALIFLFLHGLEVRHALLVRHSLRPSLLAQLCIRVWIRRKWKKNGWGPAACAICLSYCENPTPVPALLSDIEHPWSVLTARRRQEQQLLLPLSYECASGVRGRYLNAAT